MDTRDGRSPCRHGRVALGIALLIGLPVAPAAQTTTRVSVASGGVEATGGLGSGGYTTLSAVSAGGRYVAYQSDIDTLVPGDTNESFDIFVYDRHTGATTRVSTASDGTEANDASRSPAISADGQRVAFGSGASNLVPGDTNGYDDIFVHDLLTGRTTRVNVGINGAESNGNSYGAAISADGRYVAFSSFASNLVPGDTNGTGDVFVHDLQASQTTRVSVATGGGEAGGGGGPPAISADGRYVAFVSWASNLVPGDTNGRDDVFVHDRLISQTARASVATGETEANRNTSDPSISADGRYVAFTSKASNLVPSDTNNLEDVFVHDRLTGETTRVSVAAGEGEGNGPSSDSAISADGRYVAFVSGAFNLVAGDTNTQPDIFVHDRLTYLTIRVSVGLFGQQADAASHNPVLSGDGSLVVFDSAATNLIPGDTNGLLEPFVRDRVTGALSRVMLRPDGTQVAGGGGGSSAVISGDGRYIAFSSRAPDFIPGDTNGASDIFVHDRFTGQTTRVGVGPRATTLFPNGAFWPAMTPDGRYVAFESTSFFFSSELTSHTDIFVHDRQTGLTTQVNVATGGGKANGTSYWPAVSADGRYVAFGSDADNLVPGDTNGAADVFVHDRQTGQTTRVSVATGGNEADGGGGLPAISANGRHVAFGSAASNLVSGDTNGEGDVFLHDGQTGQTTRISVATGGGQGNGASVDPAISTDGRYVAFYSYADNLVPGDTNGASDVFVHDRQTGQTTRVSVGTGGSQANGTSYHHAISTDGRYVAFASWASNVVPDDTNSEWDVFVHDRQIGKTTRVSVATGGAQANGSSGGGLLGGVPAISADGQHVAFESVASNLVPDDTNGAADIFVASADTDLDGLPYDWEVQFGLDPSDATGANGAAGDADGDGRTNVQEWADQTHPTNVAALSRYLAEGAASRFFDAQLALFNPTATPARALVRYLKADGTVAARFRYVPGHTRVTLNPEDVLHQPVAEFSTQLETDALVVLDRTMRWDTTSFYGSHAETASLAPAPQWFFAEGATHSGFSLFYLVQNPHATDTAVTLMYLRPGGLPPLQKTYAVSANSRRTIWVNQEAATDPALAGLAATDVSAVVTAEDPALPVVAERAMYLDTDGVLFGAGHASAGVTAPAINWYLAEGATGDYFDLFVLLANPNATPAEVLITYLLPSGATLVRPHTVPANARFTLWVDHEDPALADTAVSMSVAVTNGVPILAERAMWWPGPTWATWAEAHSSPGSPATSTTWALAEGEVSQDWHIVTYILIANTSPTAGEARVTLYLEDGTTRARTFALAANSRFNVDVGAEFPDVVDQRFGAIVESLGPTPAQIVVERAMYSDAPGLVWAAGTNALGTRLP